MASPEFNWNMEEIASEALLVHRLLAEQESVESPQFISQTIEPQCLISSSPENTLQSPFVAANSFSTNKSEKKSLNSNRNGKTVTKIRTHLKDFTNTCPRNGPDGSLQNTPKKIQGSGEANSPVQCPSSAEFRECLANIMDMSPLLVDDLSGSLGSRGHSIDKEISQTSKMAVIDVDKHQTELDENKNINCCLQMHKDVARSSVVVDETQVKKEETTAGLVDIGNKETVEQCQPGTLHEMIDDSPTIQFRPRSGTITLPSGDVSKADETESTEVGTAVPQDDQDVTASSSCDTNRSDKPVMVDQNIVSDKNILCENENQVFNNQTCDAIFDLAVSDSLCAETSSESKKTGPQTVKEKDTAQTKPCNNVREGLLIIIDDSDITSQTDNDAESDVPTETSSAGNTSNENNSQQKSLLQHPAVPEVENVNEETASVEAGKNELQSVADLGVDISTSGDKQENDGVDALGELQEEKNVDAVPKMVSGLIKRGASTSSLPSKLPTNALPRRSVGLVKPGFTKQPEKAGPKSLKRYTSVPHSVNNQSEKTEDTNILSRTVTKTQPAVSRLARKSSVGPAKSSQPPGIPARPVAAPAKLSDPPRQAKPALKPPNPLVKPSDRSKTLMKMPQLPDRPRLITKASGNEVVRVLQSPGKQAKVQVQSQTVSRPASKLIRRSSIKQPGGSVSSQTKDVPPPSKPQIPAVDPAKTVTKEPKRGLVPMKAFGPATGTGMATKLPGKVPPVKALVPVDGSRTVTKEDKPQGSRTVTKDDQPAGSRTVTKNSGGATQETLKVPESTPMKSERSLAPRRLSDVFYSQDNLSDNKTELKRKSNSSIPTPTRLNRNSSHSSKGSTSSNSSFRKPLSLSDFESPFPGTRGSGDDSSAFRPRRALVQNTPDVEPRRVSMWSPVRKQRVPEEDMAYFCTKRTHSKDDAS